MAADAPALTTSGPSRLTAQMHPDDEVAVARARRGDEDAFRLLVERHSRSIYRLAYRMTGRPEDAEDVVQEAFVRAYKQMDRFEARSNFGTWLYRIAFNCAVDYTRTRQHRDRPESLDVLERRAPETRVPAADDLVFATEIDGSIQRALLELSAAGACGVPDAPLPGLHDRGDLSGAGSQDERGEARRVPRGQENAGGARAVRKGNCRPLGGRPASRAQA